MKGVQVDAAGNGQRFTGLLVGDDGKVLSACCTKASARPERTRSSTRGGRVLPGLIDAHGHVMGLGFAALQLDLTGTQSLAELQARLRDYAAANPGDGWILGRGWNQELWPTSASRPRPTSTRWWPVARCGWSGRRPCRVANSAAMKAAGVTAATKAPAGGRIENGLFVDEPRRWSTTRSPPPTPRNRSRRWPRRRQLMLSVGLTAAADMGTDADGWAAMNRAGRGGTLNVRIMNYAGGIPGMTAHQRRAAERLAVRRPAASGRDQALRRRRARDRAGRG